MEKHIELGKKLKALADRGVGGEKVNAEKLLKALLKKHNITIEDIEGEKTQEYFINLDTVQGKLFSQIAGKVKRDLKLYGEFPKAFIKKFKLRGNHMIKCTPAEYIEIEAKYDFYYKLYTAELKIFWKSFLKANDLLMDATEDYKPTKQQLEEWKRIEDMANKIKKGEFMRQISQSIKS